MIDLLSTYQEATVFKTDAWSCWKRRSTELPISSELMLNASRFIDFLLVGSVGVLLVAERRVPAGAGASVLDDGRPGKFDRRREVTPAT